MKTKQKVTKGKYLQFRVTEDQHKKISDYAKSKDKTMSEITIEILRKQIKGL